MIISGGRDDVLVDETPQPVEVGVVGLVLVDESAASQAVQVDALARIASQRHVDELTHVVAEVRVWQRDGGRALVRDAREYLEGGQSGRAAVASGAHRLREQLVAAAVRVEQAVDVVVRGRWQRIEAQRQLDDRYAQTPHLGLDRVLAALESFGLTKKKKIFKFDLFTI